MTDLINNEFDVPKEWRVKRIYDSNKDNFGLQLINVSHFIHSSFISILSIKAILELYTFDHLIVQRWLKLKHLLRSLFSTLRVFVEPDPSQIYGKVTIKQDQQNYCTKCYDEATMHRLLMIKRSQFCCQTVNSKI